MTNVERKFQDLEERVKKLENKVEPEWMRKAREHGWAPAQPIFTPAPMPIYPAPWIAPYEVTC